MNTSNLTPTRDTSVEDRTQAQMDLYDILTAPLGEEDDQPISFTYSPLYKDYDAPDPNDQVSPEEQAANAKDLELLKRNLDAKLRSGSAVPGAINRIQDVA